MLSVGVTKRCRDIEVLVLLYDIGEYMSLLVFTVTKITSTLLGSQ